MSDEKMAELLWDARMAIVTHNCGHPTVCADKACREAGHGHENYGEDGWSCEHECPCVPACEGHEPETCPDTTKKRETAARLEEAWRDLRAPGAPPDGEARGWPVVDGKLLGVYAACPLCHRPAAPPPPAGAPRVLMCVCGHALRVHEDGCMWCRCGHRSDCGCAGCVSARALAPSPSLADAPREVEGQILGGDVSPGHQPWIMVAADTFPVPIRMSDRVRVTWLAAPSPSPGDPARHNEKE